MNPEGVTLSNRWAKINMAVRFPQSSSTSHEGSRGTTCRRLVRRFCNAGGKGGDMSPHAKRGQFKQTSVRAVTAQGTECTSCVLLDRHHLSSDAVPGTNPRVRVDTKPWNQTAEEITSWVTQPASYNYKLCVIMKSTSLNDRASWIAE